jgi:prepilin-type N-terminal cleavage/methylation domain-containing protein
MTRRRTGFTLLELLVALTMSATIAGSLAASLYIAYRARNRAEVAIDAAHLNDAVGDIIYRDLVNAVPPTPNLNNNFVLAGPFQGDTASLEFYVSGGEARGSVRTDIKRVSFSVTTDPGSGAGSVLVRAVVTNLLSPIEPRPVQEVLCRNVQSFTISYYDGSAWYETWDSLEHNDALPLAVEWTVVQASADNPETTRQIDRRITLPCGTDASLTTASTNGGI